MCALLRLRVIPFKTYYTYGCAFALSCFFFWSLSLEPRKLSSHSFFLLLFIRPRRLYTYKLQKLARRQDMQHIRKKTPVHYTMRLLRC